MFAMLTYNSMRTVTALTAIALFLPVGNAFADIVASQSGPDVGDFTLDPGQTLAVSWTSSQSFTNVTVDVTLDGVVANGTTIQAYLTDNIGASATAADVLYSNSFANVSGPQDETYTVFSGLTLDAGTYYLVLFDGSESAAWWGSEGSEVQTSDPGVTIGLDQFAGNTMTDTSIVNVTNPFESQFTPFDTGLHFSVTGDPSTTTTSSVPEPSSTLMLAGIFACGILFRIKKARAN
jgi:hypothetical protein